MQLGLLCTLLLPSMCACCLSQKKACPLTPAEVWGALLAYSLYILLGPWLAYEALTGYPPALLFSFGALGRLPPGDGAAAPAAGAGASWRFVPTCDTFFVSCTHSLLCLLPATLWVACVVARRCQLHTHAPSRVASRSSSSESGSGAGTGDSWRRRMMESGGVASTQKLSLLGSGSCAAGPPPGTRWSFSAAQLAAFAGLAAFNAWAMYLKAAALVRAGVAVASRWAAALQCCR